MGQRITHPWGALLSRGVLVWPGDLRGCRVGVVPVVVACSQVPGSCRRAAPGPVGAPAARAPGRAPARTNELDVGKRRPMIGSEESGCWLAGAGVVPVGLVPGGVRGRRSGLTCTHPASAWGWRAP